MRIPTVAGPLLFLLVFGHYQQPGHYPYNQVAGDSRAPEGDMAVKENHQPDNEI